MEKEEILKNLDYMHHHNEHHNEELQEIADATDANTKAIIEEAISYIKQGNDLLLKAIEQLKD